MTSMLDHALQYAAQGVEILVCWGVGPGGVCGCGDRGCRSAGKHPVVPGGVHAATTDSAVLKEWFSGPAEFNIAARTGDLVVLDEDKAGALLQIGVELPNCPAVITARGRHFFFRNSNGTAIPSRAGIVPGLDVRATNGYVILPPSQHASGKIYTWVAGHSLEDLDPPELTPELVRLLATSGSNGAASDERDLFNRIKLEGLIERLEMMAADGPWRDTMLKLVGSLNGRGLPDDLILNIARRCTRRDLGFDHAQTDALVLDLIRSTRKRWDVPPPSDEPTFDQRDGEPAPTAPLRVVSGPELLTLELPPRDSVLGPWLTSKSLSMLYAPRGEGKTFLVLGIAIAVVTG